MQYKCVAGPKELVIEANENRKDAVRSYADLINREAVDGWELHSIENLAVTKKPGCISGLFGAKESTLNFNMLIFRKKITSEAIVD